jgi:L-lactate utilization protein LutB
MSSQHERDIGREIREALSDPVLEQAMSRAMKTMRERRAIAWPSPARFEELRAKARSVKEEAIEKQEQLLVEFESKAAAAGAVVVRVQTPEEARSYIVELARARSVRKVVKAKSMTSEEIHLGPALECAGMIVVEGDLGERIIQLAGERPSHLVVPAIHKSKEEIIRLFSEKMGIAHPPEDAEGLTRLVREDLRASFLGADMGITGINFAIAETGSIVLVENEGNASLTSQLPPLNVALMGSEKIIPTLADLGVFLELLPRSATGQKLTSYVSVITGRQTSPVLGGSGGGSGGSPSGGGSPVGARRTDQREFHLVILDNGRSEARADPELREILRCIRCGACLNACAPYTLVGGHVYGGDPYPGGIGCAWTYVTKGHSQAWDFGGLCTTCSRCTEVCPVMIDIPWVNTVIRQRSNKEFGAGTRQRMFARADLVGKFLSPVAPLANPAMGTPFARLAFHMLGIDPARKIDPYERQTFMTWWKHRPKASGSAAGAGMVSAGQISAPAARVALFVDCWMNHNLPDIGRDAVKVLEHLGIEVTVAHNSCCGRPAISQGMLDTPRRWAAENLEELGRLMDEGYEIVTIEPSCLSALRDDYRRLLEQTAYANDPRIGLLEQHSLDITEYLCTLADQGRLPEELGSLGEKTLLYHGHCHMKSLGIGGVPADLLRRVQGTTVHELEALCCGMVGSFGYKKEYSPLSRAIGAQLFEQIDGLDGDVVTCGVSCRSQIKMGTGRNVMHPVEVLARAMRVHEI